MLRNGRYQARRAATEADMAQALSLRYEAFIAATGAASRPLRRDEDRFDGACDHVLVEERRTGKVVCCFRLMTLKHGADIGRSYAAQFYDVSGLHAFDRPMVEMGRFCVDPAFRHDPDVLRIAWAAMTQIVDQSGVEMIFGCSSFMGTATEHYLDAFAMLRERHLAPKRWQPKAKAPNVFQFASRLRQRRPNLKSAMQTMPPLLRSYLMMGGWVSDHAVVDHDLNTLHVFTGLEISAVPPARKRLLRMAAAQAAMSDMSQSA